MTSFGTPHLSEDDIEGFVFARLPEAQFDRVGEHLLGCALCRHKVDQEERTRRLLQAARCRCGQGQPHLASECPDAAWSPDSDERRRRHEQGSSQ